MSEETALHYKPVPIGNVIIAETLAPVSQYMPGEHTRLNKDCPVPLNEKQRLESLRNLKILDTPSDERFDRIVRLAAEHFNMPVCSVNFMDDDRNWFKACTGMDATQAPRDVSMCSHAIMEDNVFVSHNLATDQRFSDNPLVAGDPAFRFYAGAPIILKDGMRVGAVCILDHMPHPEFSQRNADYLKDLARIVVDELELHKQIVDKNQKLKVADEELSVANTAKSRFLATVSHELRTPLNAIMGFGQLIAQGSLKPEGCMKTSEFAEYICDASEQLEKLVDRILLYSSAKTDELELSENEVSVKLFITKCINKVSSEAGKNNITISLWKHKYAPEALFIDEVLVGEVILQLLGNAIGHSKPDGEVRITLQRHKDGGLSVAIIDFGEGISPAKIEKAFDDFSQCEEGYDRPRDGIGLGLPIAKTLIKMHEGTLQLNTCDGYGVCAEVVLPASRNRVASA